MTVIEPVRMTRRALQLGAVPATILCAACAGQGAGSQGAPGPLAQDVTVSFLQTSGQAEQVLVNQVVERWQTAHPNGPKAELVISTGDVTEKFTTLLSAGTPPALVSLDAQPAISFADRGVMTPLDDLIRRDRYDLTDYIPSSLDQYRWKGKLYGLLRDFSHMAWWVNLDMFEKEGLPPPAGDYAGTAGGWTFDQFVEAMRRLTKRDGDGRPSQYGFMFTQNAVRGGAGQLIWGNGGEVFDKDYRKCTLDDERCVEGLQLMQDLLYRHRVSPDPAAIAEIRGSGANPAAQNMFFDGRVAAAVFPVARIGEARTQAKGRWDLAVATQGGASRGKRLTTGGGVGWFQVKSVPHQEEAWAVLQHLTSAETHLHLADVRIPGRKSVLDAWLAQNPTQAPKSRSVAKTGQLAWHQNPVFPLWDRIESEAFTPQITRLVENKAPAREVAREITAQANRLLAEGSR